MPAIPGWHATRVLGLGGCRRSEEHTSELQSRRELVCRLLLEKKRTAQRGGQMGEVPSDPTPSEQGFNCIATRIARLGLVADVLPELPADVRPQIRPVRLPT